MIERDVVLDDTNARLTVIERFFKGRSRRTPSLRVFEFGEHAIPRVRAVLARFRRLRGAVREVSPCFALAGERARQPNRQLARVLQQLQVTAPRGTYYSWHSLRKGAATCAFALHVRYESICAYGGWSVASGVAHDYIDPLAASDARGAHFFGWLMPSVVPPGATR